MNIARLFHFEIQDKSKLKPMKTVPGIQAVHQYGIYQEQQLVVSFSDNKILDRRKFHSAFNYFTSQNRRRLTAESPTSALIRGELGLIEFSANS